MPLSLILVLTFMAFLVSGLVYVHYRYMRDSENLSVAGSIGVMVAQYFVFGFLLFLFVMCAGGFNRLLIPY